MKFQSRKKVNSPADETTIVALFTDARVRLENIFGPVEDIDDDRRLGLHQRAQLGF